MPHRQELKMYPSTMLEKASILIKASINLHERSSPYVILVIIPRKKRDRIDSVFGLNHKIVIQIQTDRLVKKN